MTVTSADQFPLCCPKCGSNQLIHSGNPDFNDEVRCAACGALDTVKNIAIANATLKGKESLAAQLASTAFGGVGRKSV